MASTQHQGYLICDPRTERVVRKSRTIPAMTPLELSVFIVEQKRYDAAHPGNAL